MVLHLSKLKQITEKSFYDPKKTTTKLTTFSSVSPKMEKSHLFGISEHTLRNYYHIMIDVMASLKSLNSSKTEHREVSLAAGEQKRARLLADNRKGKRRTAHLLCFIFWNF